MLEICVDSLESAIEAEKHGAKRIELCANLIIGGTTPTNALIEAVKKNLSIPFHILIRPRFGDFLYSESEVTIMENEIVQAVKLGADGIVIGCLTKDGSLDIPVMECLIKAAKKENNACSITLHRAFDMCKDPFKALKEAELLGINTILTSGQKESCYEGRELLSQLVKECKNVQIMAGGGLKPNLIEPMHTETGIECFHLSCKKVIQSDMAYRNADVTMSFKGISEYERWVVDGDLVAQARSKVDGVCR